MSRDQIVFFETPDEIIPHLLSTIKKGDWILIKGSRQTKMEDTVRKIMEVFGLGEGQRKGGKVL
jgi:UDP-N-acetylmuramyl pentapeptide synthase